MADPTADATTKPKLRSLDRVAHHVDLFTLAFGREAKEFAAIYQASGTAPSQQSHDVLPAAEDSPMVRLWDEIFAVVFNAGDEMAPAEKVPPKLRGWAPVFYRNLAGIFEWPPLVAKASGDTLYSAVVATKVTSVLLGTLPSKDGGPPTVDDSTMRNTIRMGIKESADEIDKIQEIVDATEPMGHGGKGGGKRSLKDYSESMKLMEAAKKNERLKKILELIGKMQAVISSQITKRVANVVQQISDIKLGAELSNTLPAMFARRRRRLTQLLFNKDFIESQLLQYELSGQDPVGKGPIVYLADKSGSMDGAKDQWATALAFAIYVIAVMEKRTFVYIPFTHAVAKRDIIVCKAGEPLSTKVLERMADGPDGGTDIAVALNAALNVAERENTVKGACDILLVTDGGSDAHMAPDIRQRAKVLKTRITGIGIHGSTVWGGMDAPPWVIANLKPWCDSFVVVNKMDGLSTELSEVILGATVDGHEA